MTPANRMYDRLCKLYRLVLARMRQMETAMALPQSHMSNQPLRMASACVNPYASHRLEQLEPRVLLSGSAPGLDQTDSVMGNGRSQIVYLYDDVDGDIVIHDDMGEGDPVLAPGGEAFAGMSRHPDGSPDEITIQGLTELTLVSFTPAATSGNNQSFDPFISADGHYVSFTSSASDLVQNDMNDFMDVFVYDRQANQIERVSVNNDGQEANNWSYGSSISGDGRYVWRYNRMLWMTN